MCMLIILLIIVLIVVGFIILDMSCELILLCIYAACVTEDHMVEYFIFA